jgi:hypothetical protein
MRSTQQRLKGICPRGVRPQQAGLDHRKRGERCQRPEGKNTRKRGCLALRPRRDELNLRPRRLRAEPGRSAADISRRAWWPGGSSFVTPQGEPALRRARFFGAKARGMVGATGIEGVAPLFATPTCRSPTVDRNDRFGSVMSFISPPKSPCAQACAHVERAAEPMAVGYGPDFLGPDRSVGSAIRRKGRVGRDFEERGALSGKIGFQGVWGQAMPPPRREPRCSQAILLRLRSWPSRCRRGISFRGPRANLEPVPLCRGRRDKGRE